MKWMLSREPVASQLTLPGCAYAKQVVSGKEKRLLCRGCEGSVAQAHSSNFDCRNEQRQMMD